jgi:hypothetical protein
MAEKDTKRKPDYDDVPKVLKGPVKGEPAAQPLSIRPDYGEGQVGPAAAMQKEIPVQDISQKPDYDTGVPCPCQQPGGPPVSEEVCMPGEGDQGMLTILICPDCGTEGPFNMTPPPGVPMESRQLRCAKCLTRIPFKGLVRTASGRYKLAGADSIDALADRIRGFLKVGTILTWDICNDINTTLDRICKLQPPRSKGKDKD